MRIDIPFFFFFDRLSKDSQISSVTEIRPVRAQLFHAGRADGQVDLMKSIIALRNFAKKPDETRR